MRAVISLLLLALVGCATEPDDTVGFSDGVTHVAVVAHQVASQVAAYQDMEQCSGLSGDVQAVTFYALEAPISFPDGTTWYGVYDTKTRSVYYADDMALRHEILHDLVWTNLHRTDHPRPPFGVCVPISGD